jgi:hypothetical protein
VGVVGTGAPVVVGVVHASAGTDPNQVGPGLAGFLAVFALALATWLLFRSMNRHLRKVRYRADADAGPDGAAGTDADDGARGWEPGDDARGPGDARGDDDGPGPDDGGPGTGRAGPPPR